MRYNAIITSYFNLDAYAGELANANTIAYVARAGNRIELQAQIVNGSIQALKYRAYGPTVLLALCSFVAEQLSGKKLTALDEVDLPKLAEKFNLSQQQQSHIFLVEDAVRKLAESAHG
ncbi:MAG: iron-sulfur cluster assembly scaffold protein [Gammaproteobacteria bacterium]|nr:iron-sulfur cluster assembly scaffold protein [Gammaproteobacteria bacterium]